MCKLKKKPNQQLEPSARPSSGRGNAQIRRIPKKISPARLKRLLQNNTRPSCQACMDRRGAFDLLIGSVAKDGETLAKCASIFIEHGFPLMPVATPARMPTPLHLIGSVAKHGETLAKCTSIFIEHGFPLMPVATPARMPTPLHAAAARGLHKLLERAAGHGRRRGIASEIRTEHQRLGRRSCPHGDRHGAGYGRGRQHGEHEQERGQRRQKVSSAAQRRQLNASA